MKQFYTLLAVVASSFAFAQQTISFEASEGYTIGDINTQNGWSVTETNTEEGFLLNQVVTDEEFSDGAYSVKNAFESDFDSQIFPIIGLSKTFDTPLDHTALTVSFDVKATELDASNFELTLFAVNDEDFYVSLGGVTLDYTGEIFVVEDADYGLISAETDWSDNEWISIKIEITADEIKYYVNDELTNTIDNYAQLDIEGMTILHDNWGGDAYYDNFVITSGDLSTNPFEKNNVTVYPNPAKDVVSLTLPNNTEVEEVVVYNVTGQEVLRTNQTQNINVSEWATGTYFLKATTKNGASLTKKIIKN